MEIAIGVFIGIAIAAVSASRKRAHAEHARQSLVTRQQPKKDMTEQEVDELITVILPTIKNDK